ncbi:MAG: NAD-dependent succinate-semialdehyde dehydrogenase [Saprospiraceae bacterium]|nr:NAD-dependent succinate-semialdehyde dehydrogenase [Saprospiraceae bacterium]
MIAYLVVMETGITYHALLRDRALINGEWVAADTGKTLPVMNPFDGAVVGHVPDMGTEETKRAIAAAAKAFTTWKLTSAGKRARVLENWYRLQLEHARDLARLLTLEQGKPVSESIGEIRYGASFVEWFKEEARRVYGDVIPAHGRVKRILTLKQPVGVVAAITPWNFPSAMITRKVAPALAAGCTVVLKPAEDTPLSALALAYLAQEAGFPPGVFNVITTADPAPVGEELCGNPLVRKLSFTGSTATGKLLAKQCAGTLKKLSLELGGNAPFIVFDDADLDAAVEGALASKYRNAGQTCICANRLFAQESIYEAFVERLAQAASKQTVGNGLAEGTRIGPLINTAALDKVESLVAEAVEDGARVVTGGHHLDAGPLFYAPTVVADVRRDMRLFEEEIFGPVAPVYRFSSEEEVIALANDTPYGLAAYFYGRDHARIWRVAEALEYGMIGINTGMISTPVAPFGGVKESGMGREGSKYGIEEFVEIKYLCWDIGSS